MRLVIALGPSLLTVWLGACAPGSVEPADPLASLASPEPSSTFTAAYWTSQAHDGTRIWESARAYCDESAHHLLPNCKTVREVHFILTLREAARRASEKYDGRSGVRWPDAMAQQLEAAGGGSDEPDSAP